MTIEIAWTTVSSLCNYSVARLSLSSGQSRNRIQDTCCRHTRSWSTSLCECCVVARIVTNNVASEYKITFVLFWNVLFHFIFRWPTSMSVSEVCSFSFFHRLTYQVRFTLFTTVSSHAGSFLSVSHSLSTAALVSGIFTAWGIGISLWTWL